MARRMPTCSSCGKQHFNFETCAEASERLRRQANPPVYWRNNPDGTTGDWGNRGDTVVSLAGGRLIGVQRKGYSSSPNAAHPQYDPAA